MGYNYPPLINHYLSIIVVYSKLISIQTDLVISLPLIDILTNCVVLYLLGLILTYLCSYAYKIFILKIK